MLDRSTPTSNRFRRKDRADDEEILRRRGPTDDLVGAPSDKVGQIRSSEFMGKRTSRKRHGSRNWLPSLKGRS
jgi:hypothetical protein